MAAARSLYFLTRSGGMSRHWASWSGCRGSCGAMAASVLGSGCRRGPGVPARPRPFGSLPVGLGALLLAHQVVDAGGPLRRLPLQGEDALAGGGVDRHRPRALAVAELPDDELPHVGEL